jgi:hypothetical protein
MTRGAFGTTQDGGTPVRLLSGWFGSFYSARSLHPLRTLSPSAPPLMRGGMRTILSLAFTKNSRKLNQFTSALPWDIV